MIKMRHGSITLITLCALAMVSHAQSLDHTVITGPAMMECMYNDMEYHENNNHLYICSGDITVTISEESDAIIDCSGQMLDCSKLQLSYVGSKIMESLTISNCSVNSSLECVLAALNATSTTRLFFKEVPMPVTEETVRGLDMLAEFFISGGTLTTIPVEALKRLPNLRTHRLETDKIKAIPPNTFNHTGFPEITYLVIGENNFTTLPANAFNGLNKLESLFLFNNQLQEIDINAFKGLDSLDELNLERNNISILPSGIFSNTPLLTKLDLSHNIREMRVQTGAISGLTHLVELNLYFCKGLKLEPASFSNLPSLQSLNLEDSGITELPADLFLNTSAVVTLVMNKNKLKSLPESVFASLGKLQKLDLSNNMIENVTKIFMYLVALEELNLDGNLIQTLPEKLFSSKNLSRLSISNNLIHTVHDDAFLGVSSVTSLDLSFNQLSFECLNDNYFHFKLHSPLGVLKYMEDLNLGHNNISCISVDWLEKMTQLKDFDLSFNNLTKITSEDLNFVSYRLKLDLRDNHITTLKPPMDASSKLNLLLGRNPFHCDCHLYPFLSELNHLPYDVSDALCHLPWSLNGVALSSIANVVLTSNSLSLANLTCPLPDPPDYCSCIVRPAENRTECDCTDIQNNTLPIPFHNGLPMSQMKLTLRTVDHVHLIPEFVKKLTLSSIGLTAVPDVPDTVTFIDLRNNSLSSVPLEFLQRNITLKLGENPFKCDCWQTEDVKNLQKYRLKIKDYDSLQCTDGAEVSQVHAERLCDEMRSIAIGTSLAVLGIIVAITGALVYRYSYYIKVYLYNWGWTSLLPDESLDSSKLYDIFISYYNADEKFVKETLLPKLDNEYKVCIHSRDFEVGGKIRDQICLCVAQSRRTLIVVSNEFLSDPDSWVVQEFEAVVMQTEIDQRPRAVVVVKGDVNFDNAPDLIKNHVKMNTYIKWGENMFWERLKYALPRKLSVKDAKRRRLTKQAVKSLLGNSEGGLNGVVIENGKVPVLKGDTPTFV